MPQVIGVPSPVIVTGATPGPNPYAAGGFVVDLSASLASIGYFSLEVLTHGPNLPDVPRLEYELNTPAVGQVRVKVFRARYDRTQSVDTVTDQPAGVTVQAASGAQVNSEAAHTHPDHASHTHGQQVNAQSVDALAGGIAARVGQQTSGPAAALTHGGGSAHQHVDNNLYQHEHARTLAETDAAGPEIGALDLSGTQFQFLAVGA